MNMKKIFLFVLFLSVIITGSTFNARGQESSSLADGMNGFALRLSAELAKKRNDDTNIACSPFSCWLPLAALSNATGGSNTDALLNAIGGLGLSADEINEAARTMLNELVNEETPFQYNSNETKDNPLKIANAILVSRDTSLSGEFKRSFSNYYDGTAMSLDFKTNEAVETINEWAADNTNGLIKHITTGFQRDTQAAIVSAIYYASDWTRKFISSNTRQQVFHTQSGDIQAQFMSDYYDSHTYYEDAKIQAIPLYFANGGQMHIILPKKGTANEFLSNFDADYFNRLIKDSVTGRGKLLLPRFSFSSSIDGLGEILTDIGVPLFEKNKNPITGLSIGEAMYLTAATQSVEIKVDEQGAVAASVTAFSGAPTAAADEIITFEMNCNKPFVFVISKYSSLNPHQILFIGAVNNPNQG
jgi:serpin B